MPSLRLGGQDSSGWGAIIFAFYDDFLNGTQRDYQTCIFIYHQTLFVLLYNFAPDLFGESISLHGVACLNLFVTGCVRCVQYNLCAHFLTCRIPKRQGETEIKTSTKHRHTNNAANAVKNFPGSQLVYNKWWWVLKPDQLGTTALEGNENDGKRKTAEYDSE